MVKAEVVCQNLSFPEGPAFAPDGSLWFVELKGESLVRHSGGLTTKFKVGGRPNGIAIDSEGMIWFCDSGYNAIRRFDPVSLVCNTIVNRIGSEILAEPNDLAFDTKGNLLFSCPGNSRQNPSGYMCVYRKDGVIYKITEDKYFPNGLAFAADGHKLVFAETYRHRIWKAGWDPEKCLITEESVWCDIGGPAGPGGPDGMAFDKEGNLFVAVYGTGKIRIINPDGHIIRELILSGMNPTNCAFDFNGRYGLIITEAERGELLNVFP